MLEVERGTAPELTGVVYEEARRGPPEEFGITPLLGRGARPQPVCPITFRLSYGRISEAWEYLDTAHLFSLFRE